MKFPYYVCTLTKEQEKIFNSCFADEFGEFNFEGIWFRNQRPENKEQSNYIDEHTKRRRYIHFYDTYKVLNQNNKPTLTLVKSYLYVSNTLPVNELNDYENKIINALNEQNFKKTKYNIYEKDNLEIIFNSYDNHPKNQLASVTFPKNYKTLDIIVKTKNNNRLQDYDRMWKLSTKMFRIKEKREKPTYIKSLKEVKHLFPAQVEMGCGPSIEANIPPLYTMHETYKVQNHNTGKFYFSNNDNLILNTILKPEEQFKKFTKQVKTLLKCKTTNAYDTFAKLYHSGVFTGIVYNNNFDRLVKRYNIPEKVLRIYDKETYLPKINFDENAKSLICMGTHADRRQVQKQAREQGKIIIYVDPEGFYDKDGNFESYPIEGPKTGDYIFKTTFTQAMKEMEEMFLKK